MAVDLSMPVLVVDDYSTMIRIIRNLLKQLGFDNIDDASDGSAALNKMRGKKYGLVISDWNMEPMTGYDLLKEVRADPNLATTPFIMITAESKTENVIAAKKAGVNNYIVKPFNAATLKTKIEAVFPDMAPAEGFHVAQAFAGRGRRARARRVRAHGYSYPSNLREAAAHPNALRASFARLGPAGEGALTLRLTTATPASARGAGGRTAPSPKQGPA